MWEPQTGIYAPTPMPGGKGRRGRAACKQMRLEFLPELSAPPPPPPVGPQNTLGCPRWTRFLVSKDVLFLGSLTPAQAPENIPSLPPAPSR